jgi:hypothetical protein
MAAEPILYHTVELHYSWILPIIAVCKHVTQARHPVWPRWCARTGSGFGFGNMPNIALEALHTMFAKLLRAVVNLRALRIRDNPLGYTRWSYLQPDMFKGCTFCLSTFHIEPDAKAKRWDSLPFLTQQTGIYDWVLACAWSTSVIASNMLILAFSDFR